MEQELYHHGVKGMKWGVRKAKYHKSRYEANEGRHLSYQEHADKMKELSKRRGPLMRAFNTIDSKVYSFEGKMYANRANYHIKKYEKTKMSLLKKKDYPTVGSKYVDQLRDMKIDNERIYKYKLINDYELTTEYRS